MTSSTTTNNFVGAPPNLDNAILSWWLATGNIPVIATFESGKRSQNRGHPEPFVRPACWASSTQPPVTMLCHQCRRATAVAVRQLASSLRAQGTHARQASIPRPTRHPRGSYLTYLSSMRYSTASDATAPSSPTPATPEKPDYLDAAESEIWDKLAAEFSPTELMVQDVSGGCGSMYGIEIASEKFRGANMLKQQRMVNAVLGEQMKSWHGVQLRTKVPE